MGSSSKYLVLGSMVVAGIVALLAILDLVMGFPFAKRMTMDILLLLGAGAVGFMGYDSYRDMT